MKNCVYIFIDESGDFDFSTNGSDVFILTSVSMQRPFSGFDAIDAYKYDCLEYGLDTEYFHCKDDNAYVRNRVFNLISGSIKDMRIDSLVAMKSKVNKSMHAGTEIYPQMLGRLLQSVLPAEIALGAKQVIIITDRIPMNKMRHAVEKTIQQILAKMLPADVPYRILHHESRSHCGLQVADYCCWALQRKLRIGEAAYYDMLKPAIRSEDELPY